MALDEPTMSDAALLGAIGIPVVATTSALKVFFWNDAAEATYGWSRAEILGQSITRLATNFPDDTREASWAAIREQGRWEGEVVQKTKSGEHISVWAHVTAIRQDGEITGLIAVNRPLPLLPSAGGIRTPAQRAQEVLEAAPDSIVVVDALDRIVFVNARLEKSFGYTRTELLGQKIEVLLPQDVRVQHEAHRTSFIAEAKSRPLGVGLPLSAKRKNGEQFPVDVSLSPIRSADGLFVQAVVRDVTERHRVEQTLELIRNVTSAANESRSVDVALRSAMDLVCAVSGATFARAYRYDETLGQLVFHAVKGDNEDAPDLHAAWKRDPSAAALALQALLSRKAVSRLVAEEPEPHRQLLQASGMAIGFAFPVVSGTDVPFVLNFWCTTLPPSLDVLLGTFHQIGVQLGRVVEREVAQAQAVYSAKLQQSNEELSLFANVASHDLQEPLRMVTAFLGLLKSRHGGALDAEACGYIDFAVGGAQRMRGLLRGLLEYSQADRAPLKVATAELGVIMEYALANLRQSLVDTNAKVHCAPLPQVKCDQSQMIQLFQNVIGNALKFARPNVVPEVNISSTESPEGVVVTVRDNGIGIAENNGKRVFEIFGRLHPVDVFPGSGVGLAVCKKIVDRHGGRIWYESLPNEGTTFFVEMPKDKK